MQQQSSGSKGLAFGLAVIAGIVGLSFIICAGGFTWLLSGPEGGVRVASNMEEYATDYLADHNLLQDEEELIAYYDATISLSGEEASILTNQRVIDHRPGGTTSIMLHEIADVEVSEDALTTYISVIADDRSRIEVEVAALNNGPLFADALLREWKAARPDAVVD